MIDTTSKIQSTTRFQAFSAFAGSVAATIMLLCGSASTLLAEENSTEAAETSGKQRWTWSEDKQRVVAVTETDDVGKDPTSADSKSVNSTDRKPSSTKRMQIRQGSELVSVLGNFRDAGDRIIFYSADNSMRLVVLENLSLERVGKILEFAPEELLWQVSGVVTEYDSQNYLLLSQAVLQSSDLRIPLEGSN